MTRFFTLPRERSQFLHCCGTVCRQQRVPGHTGPACAQCAPAPDTHFPKDLSAKSLFEIAKVQKPPTVFPVCFCEPFDRAVGGPGDDMRVLASMPAPMLVEGIMAARTTGGRRLTAVEAIQVGMKYRACHRLVHLMAGGSQSTWKDPGPWAATSSEGTTSQGSPGSTPERKMKLSQVADQGDESEFVVLPEASKAKYYTKYVAKVGGMPADSEDPTVEQISPIVRKVFTLGQPPYPSWCRTTGASWPRWYRGLPASHTGRPPTEC